MSEAPPLDTKIPQVGFCSKCGIVREDVDGRPITDCVCTALAKHEPECMYVKAVSCWIDLGLRCDKHDEFPCEECDCTCKAEP